jgi:hypothetical protein
MQYFVWPSYGKWESYLQYPAKFVLLLGTYLERQKTQRDLAQFVAVQFLEHTFFFVSFFLLLACKEAG